MTKKTIVIGASTNPERYSYKAVTQLKEHNVEVIPFGVKKGEIQGVAIQNELKDFEDIHTITLYLNQERQQQYYDYIISLHPKRIIFNPGAENAEFKQLANEQGIETVEACTLVMLSTGQF